MKNRKFKVNIVRLLILAVIVVLWQAGAGSLFPVQFFSKPSAIVMEIIRYVSTGRFLVDFKATSIEIGAGYLIGSIFGFIMGVVLGRMNTLYEILDPFIMAFYGIPKIALAPLFILVLGIGMSSKIGVAAISVVFLMFFNTYTGITTVNEEYVNLARLMGAKPKQVTTTILIPYITPFIIVGLKSGLPYAIIGAIIGEFISSNEGIGYYILQSSNTFNAAGLFGGVIILLVLIVVLNGILNYIEPKLLHWKPPVKGSQQISV